ncbi:hypothetical protein [Paenibacillus spongiae]|uniref:Uncharacterized protein n=1 Tax=Paenibacillus spongiae TaxID=2909671 RepID=A0ABY5S5T0_9BACL|nr:hypothetical protein [Paenibacillus spongiae]UVI28195.1 hypothetical protein L1F29_22425 [Paenibacillus spongiae]
MTTKKASIIEASAGFMVMGISGNHYGAGEGNRTLASSLGILINMVLLYG